MCPETPDVQMLSDLSGVDLGHTADCIRAAARSDGHDMFWAAPQGVVHELCVELERRGVVDRHADVGSPLLGWRPR